MNDPQPERHEIIIVKRRARSDHGHHGGAWKIAYADFVTAMMAFFLVMWLINAANEKTRAQVASYFNPIKLTDTATAKKGLSNPLDRTPTAGNEKTPPAGTAKAAVQETDTKKPEGEKQEQKPVSEEKNGKYSDEELFRNPYGILGLLAGQTIHDMNGRTGKGLVVTETSNHIGSTQADPFHPYALRVSTDETQPPAQPDVTLSSGDKPAKQTENLPKAPQLEQAVAPNIVAAKPTADIKSKENIKDVSLEKTLPAVDVKDSVPSNEPNGKLVDTKEALRIRDQIIEKLKEFQLDKQPEVEVKQTSDGILISLTDSLNFDMFSVGSAQPQPQLVILMEKISDIIKEYDGRIVLRGHTDSRPFKNGTNDNWRLSASRAQMAFYMLTRAGLDESKVERIEGYADHDLKFPDQPEMAGNRRIEILLKAKPS